MADENPRKRLYKSLIAGSDRDMADAVRKYSFAKFDQLLTTNPEFQKDLFSDLKDRDMVQDEEEFARMYLSVPSRPQPTQPAPAPPSLLDITRQQVVTPMPPEQLPFKQFGSQAEIEQSAKSPVFKDYEAAKANFMPTKEAEESFQKQTPEWQQAAIEGSTGAELARKANLPNQKQPSLLEKATSYGKDIIKSVTRGWKQGEAIQTAKLTDVASGNAEGIDFDAMAKANKEVRDIGQTATEQDFAKSDGMWDDITDYAKMAIPVISESIATLFRSGIEEAGTGAAVGAGMGSIVPGIGTAVGAATGATAGISGAGYNMELYASIMDELEAKGIDVSDANQLKAAFSDKELMGPILKKANTRAAIIGSVDLVGGMAGNAAAQSLKAARPLTKTGRVLQNIAKVGSKLDEVSTGAGGEALAQYVTTGKINPQEVALEGLGEAPIVGGIKRLAQVGNKPNQPPTNLGGIPTQPASGPRRTENQDGSITYTVGSEAEIPDQYRDRARKGMSGTASTLPFGLGKKTNIQQYNFTLSPEEAQEFEAQEVPYEEVETELPTTYEPVTEEEFAAWQEGNRNPERMAGVEEDADRLVNDPKHELPDDPLYQQMVVQRALEKEEENNQQANTKQQPQQQTKEEIKIEPIPIEVGQFAVVKGEKGEVKQEENGQFVLETPTLIYELDDRGLAGIGAKLLNQKPDTKPQYEIEVVSDDVALVDGVEYEIIKDQKGNTIALKGPERTIRTEPAMVDVDIKRNKIETQETPEQQVEIVQQLLPEATTDKQGFVDQIIGQNMTERVATLLDQGLTENTTEQDLLQLKLWADATIADLLARQKGNPYAQEAIEAIQETLNVVYYEYYSKGGEFTSEGGGQPQAQDNTKPKSKKRQSRAAKQEPVANATQPENQPEGNNGPEPVVSVGPTGNAVQPEASVEKGAEISGGVQPAVAGGTDTGVEGVRRGDDVSESSRHNSLLNKIQDYNNTPTNRRGGMLSEITKIASNLGYSVGSKGKNTIQAIGKNGKPIRRIPTKSAPEISATDDEKTVAKKMIDAGFFNWDGDIWSPRLETELQRADIRKGLADINAGKTETEAAKRLIKEANRMWKNDEVSFIIGPGKGIATKGYSISEVLKIEEEFAKAEEEGITDADRQMANDWWESLTNEEKYEYEKGKAALEAFDGEREGIGNEESEDTGGNQGEAGGEVGTEVESTDGIKLKEDEPISVYAYSGGKGDGWFTTNKAEAVEYAFGREGNRQLNEGKITLKKPFVVNSVKEFDKAIKNKQALIDKGYDGIATNTGFAIQVFPFTDQKISSRNEIEIEEMYDNTPQIYYPEKQTNADVSTESTGRENVSKKQGKPVVEAKEADNGTDAQVAINQINAIGMQNPINPRETIINGVRVEVVPYEGKGVEIQSIESTVKGRGDGTRVLKKLTDISDLNGVPLVVYPTQIENTTEEQLRNWYAKNGFVEQENGEMIYSPKAKSRDEIVRYIEGARRAYREKRAEDRAVRQKRKQELIDAGMSEDDAVDLLIKEATEEEAAFEKTLPKIPALQPTQLETESEKHEADFKKMRQETGAKRSDRTWGGNAMGEDMGYQINENEDAAIFIKPHEEQIETEDGVESAITGTAIELVYVAPEKRGTGEAKKLIQKVVDAADKTGTTLHLDIAPQDKSTTEKGLKKLYEGFRFKIDEFGHGVRESQFTPISPQKIKAAEKPSIFQAITMKGEEGSNARKQFSKEEIKKAEGITRNFEKIAKDLEAKGVWKIVCP